MTLFLQIVYMICWTAPLVSAACSAGFYLSVGSTCEPCSPNCLNCSVSDTRCTSCNAGSGLMGSTTCSTCHSGCQNCSTSMSVCDECKPGLTSQANGICIQCDKACLNSQCSISTDNCTEGCISGYYRDHTYATAISWAYTRCKACSANCAYCTVGTSCVRCQTGYFLYNNECKDSVPELNDGRNIGIIAGIGGVVFIGLIFLAVKVIKAANVAYLRYEAAVKGQGTSVPTSNLISMGGQSGPNDSSNGLVIQNEKSNILKNEPGAVPLGPKLDLPPNFS